MYNSYIPQFYPPVQPQPNRVISQPTQSAYNFSVAFTQGESSAKAFPVASGQTVYLFDIEESVFYLKSVDQNGVPSPLKVYDYKERIIGTPEKSKMEQTTEYVSKEEFDKFKNEIRDEIRRRRKPDEIVKDTKNV